tara:strand:+ start:4266 stop:4610 length:345 start_codon:yes stop_codon:yes gene_type:complete
MTASANMFGHRGVYGNGVFLDAWGHGPLLMRYKGREWWFEFSDMFGPVLLRKSDKEPSARQPVSETDPFWEPFQLWFAAGRKTRPIRDKRTTGDLRRAFVRYRLCHVPRGERLG